MECPNCSFNNTPGMPVCVRCQSRLDLRDVDIEPPRAGGSIAVRHARWRLRAVATRGIDGLRATGQRIRNALHPSVDWPSVLWSIVPGLGHALQGHARTGAILFGIWGTLIVLALGSAGSGRGWFLASCAVAFHCFVISRLMATAIALQPILRQLQIGLIVYLSLILTLYGPAVLFSRATVRLLPVSGVRGGSAITNGDVLACSGPWLRPNDWEYGDLVVYRIRGRTVGGAYVEAGWGVDRVVGLPGDTVIFEERTMTVNGEVRTGRYEPLGGARSIPDMLLQPGPNQVAVLPSLLQLNAQGANAQRMGRDLVRSTAVVHENDIAGKVWFRLRPWRHFGPIREGDAK